MRRIILLPFLLAGLFLNLGLYIGEANPPNVNVTGKVINGTNDGSPVADLQMFLHKQFPKSTKSPSNPIFYLCSSFKSILPFLF